MVKRTKKRQSKNEGLINYFRADRSVISTLSGKLFEAIKSTMNSKKQELRRLAKVLAKIGDSLVEKHAIAVGKLKAAKPRKRSSRKSIAEELKDLSKKLAGLGDKLHDKNKKRRGVKALIQPTKQIVKNVVVHFVRKLLVKPETTE